MGEDEKLKIINFIQDFGCCSVKQLQILFNRPGDNFKSILSSGLVSKKDDIFVFNRASIDMKMIYALDVLCKFKKRIQQYHRTYGPVSITFLTKDNLLYNIIIISKSDEKGILKLLKNNSPLISEADKYILLFEDTTSFDKVDCKMDYICGIYPEIKIFAKKS